MEQESIKSSESVRVSLLRAVSSQSGARLTSEEFGPGAWDNTMLEAEDEGIAKLKTRFTSPLVAPLTRSAADAGPASAASVAGISAAASPAATASPAAVSPAAVALAGNRCRSGSVETVQDLLELDSFPSLEGMALVLEFAAANHSCTPNARLEYSMPAPASAESREGVGRTTVGTVLRCRYHNPAAACCGR